MGEHQLLFNAHFIFESFFYLKTAAKTSTILIISTIFFDMQILEEEYNMKNTV